MPDLLVAYGSHMDRMGVIQSIIWQYMIKYEESHLSGADLSLCTIRNPAVAIPSAFEILLIDCFAGNNSTVAVSEVGRAIS